MKWNWNRKWSWLLYGVAIAAGTYAAYVAWFAGDRLDLGAGFASANGRIEGVEIDVAAKTAGRVTAVLMDEGEFVKAGDGALDGRVTSRFFFGSYWLFTVETPIGPLTVSLPNQGAEPPGVDAQVAVSWSQDSARLVAATNENGEAKG